MQKRPWSQTWQKPISACMPTWFDPGLHYPLTDSFQYRQFAWIVKLYFLEKRIRNIWSILSSARSKIYKKVCLHQGGLNWFDNIHVSRFCMRKCRLKWMHSCIIPNSTKINKEVLKRCIHWRVTCWKFPFLYNCGFGLNTFYFIEITIQSYIHTILIRIWTQHKFCM